MLVKRTYSAFTAVIITTMFFSMFGLAGVVHAADPVLLSPVNGTTVTVASFDYQWEETTDATWYQLKIDKGGANVVLEWYEVGNGVTCAAGTCTLAAASAPALGNGIYDWTVLPWTSAGGNGIWYNSFSFTQNTPLPSLIAPVDGTTVTALSFDYQWDETAGATWYKLEIDDNATGSNVVSNWYQVGTSVACSGGTCTLGSAFAPALPNSSYTWTVMPWSPAGDGNWYGTFTFMLNAPVPVLLAPTNGSTQTTASFDYQWEETGGATWYKFKVDESGGGSNVVEQWYGVGAGVTCSGGTCTLSAASAPLLSNGDYNWTVMPWSSTGSGNWYGTFSLTVSVPVPELVYPANNTTITYLTPTYQWEETPGATWYQFKLDEVGDGNKVLEWYKVGEEIYCIDGSCAFTSSFLLTQETDYTWTVLPWGADIGTQDWYAAFLFTTAPPPPSVWTFLVYMSADNSMESAAIDDFLEMASSGSNNDVKILVQFDRGTSTPDDTNYDDWKDTRRFLVTPGMIPRAADGQPIGEANMGDPQTLIDFVEWGKINFPADQYALIFWDHGNATRNSSAPIQGIAWDDTDSNDFLTMPELNTALKTITNDGTTPLDLVGFDASLMGMIEIDNELLSYAKLRVGSEETEPSDGWAYDDILADVDGSMFPSELGALIVSIYDTLYADNYTQSSVDLGANYTILNTAVNDFATALMNGYATFSTELGTARNNSQVFSNASYIDLYDYASQVQLAVNDVTIDNAAANVITAVGNVVLAEAHGVSTSRAHGISIYFPDTAENYLGNYDDSFGELTFTTNTQWDEWINTFYGNALSSNLIAPADTTTITTSPTFSWEKTQDATWYRLKVDESGGTNVILEWYQPGNGLTCSDNVCTLDASTPLPNGDYVWTVMPWDATNGDGDWYTAFTFTQNIASPELISPANGGTITTVSPVLEWGETAGATWYELKIDIDGGGNVSTTWHEVGNGITCSESRCTLDAGLILLNGTTYSWTVRPWESTSGSGYWYSAFTFTVNMPVPELLSPSGGETIADSTPKYQWDESTGATWYNLRVYDGAGNLILKWYEVGNGVTCASEICSVISGTVLPDNNYTWTVQPWDTANGNGAWYGTETFTVVTN